MMQIALILGGCAVLGAVVTSLGVAAFAVTGGRSDTALSVAVGGMLLFLLACVSGAILQVIASALEVMS